MPREEFGEAEGENRWPEPLRARFARLGHRLIMAQPDAY
ncbi:protein of unknown function (plasmid) [Methylocella tundrae]|uniref:Uncharacterized protein n=1 Tax=Methylocella tundrae TaxID=227605 RepID=A0A4U8Z7Q9_METTU|nr:protein of unknown function [Methylocella tundrae]